MKAVQDISLTISSSEWRLIDLLITGYIKAEKPFAFQLCMFQLPDIISFITLAT